MNSTSNASSLPSTSESPVWKNPMSQQEFNSNNTEGFYKTEYGMHRHFMDHSQPPPNAGSVDNFMASSAAVAAVAAAASARLADNNMDQQMSTAGASGGNPGPGGNTNGGVPNYNKIKKSHEDYDKFVDIVKNIVDTHKSTPDKVDTFSDFIKSYMRRWPERLQDEAINHITNYVIVKNMEHSMGGVHNPEGVNNRQ
ncbi:uncharacterized protein LOC115621159 isoform X2 [Scaptodrosophila lebanonensis]|nr:uncharacterized protein LOC115621159 isoform X2 [Scaptodrosophila lebanonensis]